MVNSFELHLRTEKKSPKTIRTYLDAAQWFAAEYLIPAGLVDWADTTYRPAGPCRGVAQKRCDATGP
jgi:hypothetical protein